MDIMQGIQTQFFDILKNSFIIRFAINPARDLGPRVMISLFGWGWEAFSGHGYWFWIPLVCQHMGGVVGVMLHWVIVEHQWGTRDTEEEEGEEMEKKPKVGCIQLGYARDLI